MKEKNIDSETATNKLGDFITKGAESIDKKCLAEAIAITAMSWFAIPVIYWLIVRKKKDEKTVKKETRSDDRHQQEDL